MSAKEFLAHPAPVVDYETSLARIKDQRIREIALPGFNPDLQTIFMTHGHRTRRVVLWFHGYTSATLQFKPLGDLCFERGYNVLIPCIPHHGFKNRMSPEVSRVTALELVRFCDQMVDLAFGLGEEVVVGGLSLGGVMAAWVAQEREEASKAIIIAPFFGAKFIPPGLTRLAAYAGCILPDIKVWWNPAKKENPDGPKYGYPRFSTHSAGQILRMGINLYDLAAKTPPCSENIFLVLNDNDQSVNNPAASQLVQIWKHYPGKDVTEVHFPKEVGLPHDCISVEAPVGNTGFVYPQIMEMIG